MTRRNVQHGLQRRSRWMWWLALLICVPVLAACGQQAQRPPLNVVATIGPLADWARHVGRDRVNVVQIVPSGVDPETYELTAVDRRALLEADIVLCNGLGIEPWLEDVLTERDPQSFHVFQSADFVGPLPQGRRMTARPPMSADVDGEQLPPRLKAEAIYVPATVYSPYLWLNPGAMMAQRTVLFIADTFTRADPDNIRFYRGNAERYTGELENLDGWIMRQVAQWPKFSTGTARRPMIQVSDHTWFYFADQYGISLRTPQSGPVLSPDAEQRVALFVNRTTMDEEQVRMRTDRAPDGVLDPFAFDNYIEMMKQNVELMSQAVKQAAARSTDVSTASDEHSTP